MEKASEAAPPEKCQNCQNKALLFTAGFWLCKECFNREMELPGIITRKLRNRSFLDWRDAHSQRRS